MMMLAQCKASSTNQSRSCSRNKVKSRVSVDTLLQLHCLLCRESVAINASLMNLGRCLEALRWNQQHRVAEPKLVPYRESKVNIVSNNAMYFVHWLGTFTSVQNLCAWLLTGKRHCQSQNYKWVLKSFMLRLYVPLT